MPTPFYNFASGSPVPQVWRVSAGFMAAGQTAKQYVGKQSTSTTAATTVTLETVTTGKTYYITDITIFTRSKSVV